MYDQSVYTKANFLLLSNNANRSYELTVTGENPTTGENFELSGTATGGGEAKKVYYNVAFASGPTGDDFKNVNYKESVSGSLANNTSVDCSSGGESARLKITIPEANLSAVRAGKYSDLLTLVVSPKS